MKKLMTAAVAGMFLVATGCAANAYEAGPGVAGFGAWDTNRDALLDQREFGAGFDPVGPFDDWDANNDNMLDEREWGIGMSEMGVRGGAFADWDADRNGMLTDREFGAGVFNTLDTADDGFLDEGEWGAGVNWW